MKIALITKNWNFLAPLKQELETTVHDVKQFWPVENEHVNWVNIMNLMRWCDVAFFDFAQTPLVEISHLAVKPCKIVVRVLGLEVFYNVQHINWQHVDHIICISEHQRQRLLEAVPSLNDRGMPPIDVIPLGVNIDTFTIPVDKRFGFDICQVGNMLPHKRHYETIQLLRQLIDSSSPWWPWQLHVHHTTEGGFRSNQQKEYTIFCEDLVKTLELEDRVTFYPADPSWQTGGGAEFFKDKDIIISNSQMEGYHKTPLEGMACGLMPIVNCWRGSDKIYPASVVFKTFDEAIEKILWWANLSETGKHSFALAHRNYVVKNHNELIQALRVRDILISVGSPYEVTTEFTDLTSTISDGASDDTWQMNT